MHPFNNKIHYSATEQLRNSCAVVHVIEISRIVRRSEVCAEPAAASNGAIPLTVRGGCCPTEDSESAGLICLLVRLDQPVLAVQYYDACFIA